MRIRVSQLANIAGRDEFLRGPRTWLPFPPFPGLHVGAMTVENVYVNQGGESDEVEVEYAPVFAIAASLMEKNGWTREGIES